MKTRFLSKDFNIKLIDLIECDALESEVKNIVRKRRSLEVEMNINLYHGDNKYLDINVDKY